MRLSINEAFYASDQDFGDGMVDRFLEGGFTCFFEGVEGTAFEGGVGFDRVEDFVAEFAFAGWGVGVVVFGVLVD